MSFLLFFSDSNSVCRCCLLLSTICVGCSECHFILSWLSKNMRYCLSSLRCGIISKTPKVSLKSTSSNVCTKIYRKSDYSWRYARYKTDSSWCFFEDNCFFDLCLGSCIIDHCESDCFLSWGFVLVGLYCIAY